MKFKPYDIKAQTENDFVTYMVMESIKLLDSYSAELKYKFLVGFMSHLVFSALKLAPPQPCGKKELIEFTKNNFANVKSNIQNATAVAFTDAMTLYLGKNFTYTCSIKADDTPPSKGMLN